MTKRLNIFILVVFLLGQTIIGPIGSTAGFVSAAEQDGQGDKKQDETVKVDKDALKEALEDAENYDEADYEADSYAAFVDAVTAGKNLVENEEATQDEVDKAVTAIEKAIKALQKATTPEDEGDSEEGEGTEKDENKDDKQISPLGFTTLSNDEENEYKVEIELDNDHINGFTFKVNGQEFTEGGTIEGVSNEDEFELVVDLVDPLKFDDLNYGPNTKLKYPLPDGFSNHFTYSDNLGPLSNYGNVKIEGGFVVITLNDKVIDEASGLPFDIENGAFEIKGNFSDDNDEWGKEIAMPGGEKFTVNFKPKSGDGVTINKENGKPNKNGQKSDEIEWKVTVNTNLANDSDKPVFTDTLSASGTSNVPTGHTYDKNSVKVYEINVKPNGDTSERNEVSITPSFNDDDNPTEMTIDLEEGKAYEITYTTIPDNPDINEWVQYKNTADYDGNKDTGQTSYVSFGKAIEKSASSVDPKTRQTEWTITYNGNEQVIKSGTTMSDEWTTKINDSNSTQTPEQKLVDGAGGVTVEGLDSSKYTVNYTDGEQGFNIVFNENFSDTITIKYKTEPVEDLKGSENFTVTNEAKHGQIDTSDTKTVKYNTTDLTLKKSADSSGLDYETRTMKWKITANQAGYQMDAGTTFEDTFRHENMVLVPDEFVVKVDGTEIDKANEGDSNGYVFTNNNEKGFTVKLNAATDKEVVIEYTTSFDQIKNVDEDRSQNYYNDVKLNIPNLPGEPTDTANIDSNTPQKKNGSKEGSYNYETKEFTWTIIFNYNSNTLNEAVLKDVLPEEHKITSATLEKGSINSGGTFVRDSDQTGVTDPSSIKGSNSFELDLGKIEEPHKLVYTTKMKDDVFPVDGEQNYSVENKAELFDGDTPEPNASWEKKVTVKHSKKVLDKKNGKQIDNSDLIEWDFLYNTAQSKLKNVKITDTFQDDPNLNTPNQILDEESLEVYKVTYDSEGSINEKGEKLTAGTDYKVSFNEDGATFILEFEELTHGIYVEYESVFIGVKDSPIANELSVTYNDGDSKTGSSDVPNLSFHYGAFASTSAGKFVIIKTDEATGEAMEGVEFTLERGNRTIMSGTTDENGVLDFGMPFATGTYKLTEKPVADYEALNGHTFELKSDGGPYEGKQVVNVTNTPTEYKDKMCPDFTVTVKDEEDNPVEKGKTIKLVNQKTDEEFTEETDENGQIVKDREDLPAGDYKVYEIDNGEEIFINELEVRYAGEDNTECNAEVRPEVIDIPVTKTWKDGEVDNETRPDITIQLLAGEDKLKEITLDETKVSSDDENVWEYSFENLRKMNNAGTEEIKYTVEELDVDGYKSTVDGYNITNVRTSDETLTIPVEKVWKGPEVEKEAVTIILLADGENEDSVELSETNQWKGSFEDLAIYNDQGEEIKYTVEEVAVDGYNSEITGDAEEGFTVTNTRSDEKSITITKGWKDDNNPNRPSSIEVKLFRSVDGDVEATEVGGSPYTVKAEDDWSLTIDGLPAFDDNGKAYRYEIKEVPVDGYESTVDGFDITNLRVGTTEVSGTKTWEKDEASDRPESITVNLLANGKKVDSVEVTAEDDWIYSFDRLDKYDENGKEITYTVTEDVVDGYETSYDGYNITNTKLCEKFTVEVEDENGDPITEEEYTFESEDGKKITKKTDKDGKVTFDREELPEGKYTVKDKDGNKVGEIDVEYNVDCEDNLTKVIVPVEKPEDPKTCEEVEITITEDGKPSKNKTYTLTSKDGKPKVTITTDKDGKVTIDRSELPNGKYTVTDKDGNVVGEVEITDDCVVELDITSESDDIIGKILPKTATQTFLYIALGLGLLALGVTFQAARRRNEA